MNTEEEGIIATMIGCVLTLVISILLLAILVYICGCSKIDTPVESIKDVDGNIYPVKLFGEDYWMISNLKTSHLYDYTCIHKENDCIMHYPDKYEFYTVETDKLCPYGWHVAKHWEWINLYNYINDNNLPWDFGEIGYWWADEVITSGAFTGYAYYWCQNLEGMPFESGVHGKDTYLNVRCVKDK